MAGYLGRSQFQTLVDITDGSVTADDLASGAITSAALPAGSVLQVVESNTDTSTTVTGSTRIDTALSASITPSSASNKILVINTQGAYARRDYNDGFLLNIYLMRGATDIADRAVFIRAGLGYGSSLSQYTSVSMTLLDSPNTTSAVTYKTQIRLNPSYTGSNAEGLVTQLQSITLLEIAV